MKQKKLSVFCLVFVVLFGPFLLEKSLAAQKIPALAFSVKNRVKHDPKHFTQGLVLRSGKLFESAGGYGQSAVFEKNPGTGAVRRSYKLPDEVFAEGLTQLGAQLFLLSWRNGRAYRFDTQLRPQREFSLEGEGWGLTDDGRQLILSDGSSSLRWLDPKSFKPTRKLTVRADGVEVDQLNELEYARGFIYANIWHSDRIAVISPKTGEVRAWLDFSTLKNSMLKPPGWDADEHVLNGIAYDAERDLFYITGKCWPLLFEVQIEALR